MSDIANNPDVSGIKLPPLPADYVPTPSPVTPPVVVPVKENHTKGFIFLGIAVVVIIAALLVLF